MSANKLNAKHYFSISISSYNSLETSVGLRLELIINAHEVGIAARAGGLVSARDEQTEFEIGTIRSSFYCDATFARAGASWLERTRNRPAADR